MSGECEKCGEHTLECTCRARPTMKTAREIIAEALEQDWNLQGDACNEPRADSIIAALSAEGFSIVETGRDPYMWLLETDDDTLICRSGTKSITVRAKHATVFDIASVEPPKIVPVSALSCPTREGKTG